MGTYRKINRGTRDAQRQQRAPGRDLYRTARWKALRKEILRRLPHCAVCGGKAGHVDHIRPHRGDVTLFFSLHNLQQLCHSCHSSKTALFDGGFGRAPKEGARACCSSMGEVLDPGHPWFEEK